MSSWLNKILYRIDFMKLLVPILVFLLTISFDHEKVYKVRGFLIASNTEFYFIEQSKALPDSAIMSLITDSTLRLTSVNYVLAQSKITKYQASMKEVPDEIYKCGEEFRKENRLRYLYGDFFFVEKILSDKEMNKLKMPDSFCMYSASLSRSFSAKHYQSYDVLKRVKALKN